MVMNSISVNENSHRADDEYFHMIHAERCTNKDMFLYKTQMCQDIWNFYRPSSGKAMYEMTPLTAHYGLRLLFLSLGAFTPPFPADSMFHRRSIFLYRPACTLLVSTYVFLMPQLRLYPLVFLKLVCALVNLGVLVRGSPSLKHIVSQKLIEPLRSSKHPPIRPGRLVCTLFL